MKLFILFLLTLKMLLAINLNYFNATFEKTLKKDEQMIILTTIGEEEKLLIFRWTLFHNKGLVSLVNYNGEPMQHLLYKRYRQDSIKIDIALRKNETSRYHPYILITFLGYNYENRSAKFKIYHKDPSGLSSIELK